MPVNALGLTRKDGLARPWIPRALTTTRTDGVMNMPKSIPMKPIHPRSRSIRPRGPKANSSELKEAPASLLKVLQHRFVDHMERHKGFSWADVQARLETSPEKLRSLADMERTGGEPDVVGRDGDQYLFVDCSPQSPFGRRSLCYDQAAWQSRKEARPKGSATAMAKAMGIELLTEAQYRALQELGAFDTTTSSWIETAPRVRELGGAMFCDRRYDRVFVYHNGAESYYAGRGFRGMLHV